ncbi:MAG: DUF935 family protein [Paludibacter sp.]|nr:DUF935 family protein [Paludibacter sp.]
MSNRNKYIKQQLKLAATNNNTGRKAKQPPLEDTRDSDKIEIDYFHLYESLYRKEVTDWQNSRTIRYDPFNPVTYPIQQLYKDSMLDNHLSGAINQRILRVQNKKIIVKDTNETEDFERSKWLNKKWFRHFIKMAMESKFYGYSMVFIEEFEAGNIKKIKDIYRENIIPEKGLLLKDAYNPAGTAIRYNDFSNFLIYIQLDSNAVGILERVAPMTIFKRHSWASWDDFEQIFGVPIRIARTAINTKNHKDDLQQWLSTMGKKSYAIFDKQTDIEIKENSKTDSFNVFDRKIERINKEISKGILGQTMTMDDGSSHSQAAVHSEILQDITDADIMDVQDWINDDFLSVLRNLGYDIPEGYTVELIDKKKTKTADKIKVDGVLMQNGYNLNNDYIESTYDVILDEENPRSDRNPQNQSLSFFE